MKAPAPSSNGAVSTPAPVAATAEDTKVPLNYLRGIIADRTQHSKQTVPHFYVTVEVDLEAINGLRDQFKAQDAGKVSVNDFVVKASVLALQEMPVVNSTFQGDHLLQYGNINIGVAAAVDDGLLVPVIHGAQNMSLRQLSDRARELVGKARDGKLGPNEMQGSTFSISNMGMLNVDSFSAIINEPNAAIIAIGTASRKVVVNDDDELEIRSKMNITTSFDHRVVDGAVGANFINRVKFYLENPMHLLG
ncbi:MAG: dihydrolipoamide acetyltransferase family protein [Fimbriimonadaceae bacterium]